MQSQEINKDQQVENVEVSKPGDSTIFKSLLTRIKEQNLPFTENEHMAIQDIFDILLQYSMIRGEKNQTIICFVQYLISQLSGNPELNKLSLGYIAEKSQAQLFAVKRLWNTTISQEVFLDQIPKWQGQRPISELKSIE
ncbi:unnamed protein product (macronuclear) [Paramecium tetraurelia]|uniref:Uncharacterized protein n=1 Tax=Paramecium tetraurelia TaxID=5888 RepID=A0BD70_PARTE|nr:uncharacterized protein GSPATT00004581001 [Paramecium tetraurelia]CAK56487.1 unnamed protein product [Paramecium tetraurelia]|eukprot:XP_001423885.1 hypothetical protein (macronuclear) [Paramecium tetraurelia strain d4-2]